MLRIGDLLDMDNGRFNRSLLEVMGGRGESSIIHMFKHEAVTHFLVTPLEIEVQADFKSDLAGRLLRWQMQNSSESENPSVGDACGAVAVSEEVRNEKEKKKTEGLPDSDSERRTLCMKSCMQLFEWLEMLEKELEFFAVKWQGIAPRKFPGAVPQYKPPILKIDGVRVEKHELQLQYEISPKRSAEIIEGSGIYKNPQNVFLREVLQNALDATKLQLYRDVLSGMHQGFGLQAHNAKENKEILKKLTPMCFFERLMPAMRQYRIETRIEVDPDNEDNLLVRVRDYGTGISYEALKGMQQIGAIEKSEEEQNELKAMPDWLKPTGHFGIGLQTVFYVAKSFKIRSRARYKQGHEKRPPLREMTFYSTRLGGNIDVRLCDDKGAEAFGFGTEVLISIPLRMPADQHGFFVMQQVDLSSPQRVDAWANRQTER
jgi:hypothetical protein